MSEKNSSFTSGREADSGRLGREITSDLDALGRRSSREFPTLDATVRSVRQKNHESMKEATFMSSIRGSKARPLLITASVIAVVVIALLAVPIPYDKTVGHDVTLKLDATALNQSQVMAIAKELKTQLGVDQVKVGILSENGRRSYEMMATVPTGTGVHPERVAEAFASNLEASGFRATAEVTPKVERVSTTVYAYAQGQVIEISMDGKSSEQIAAEIRQALFDAGVSMAEVSVDVTDNPDGTQEVRIEVEAECEDSDPCEDHPQIRLTKEGESLGGELEDCTVRVKKLAGDDGTQLIVEVTKDGQTIEAEVGNIDEMSDAELASEIETALSQQGVSASVDVVNGRIEIQLDQ
jgi:hypothetical protein